MKVLLLQHTPDPELTVALAARLCYSPSGVEGLREGLTPEGSDALIRRILKIGHHSVLEHASFTFGVEGISRAASHQLVRHRIASYSQQSQRYVKLGEEFESLLPPTIASRKDLREKYRRQMRASGRLYRECVEAGIPAEDARFLLPNAAATKIIVTMNARALRHFFGLRCCLRAQWEIRGMAEEMLGLARRAAPVLFEGAGPGCLRGKCPEKEMTCGKTREVRRAYREWTPGMPRPGLEADG